MLLLLLLSPFASASSFKLSEPQREQIIRAFLAERPFVHRALPLGKAGVVIEGAKISPSEAESLQFAAAARPGERVQITAIRFLRDGILFEINGGPEKHKKWSERISVGRDAPDDPASGHTDDSVVGGFGSSVLLKLEDSDAITPDRIQTLLAPVLDFRSASQAEAYQKVLPPVLAGAVKEHRALVGMDRDMVLAAMGRPPRRLRESSNGQEYEEWIYGTPPQEVRFIRFVRGKVVRIEEMKVTGEKLVRTQDEVGKLDSVLDASTPKASAGDVAQAGKAATAPAMAAPAESAPDAGRKKPPTLLRPGESLRGHDQSAPIPLPASVPQRPDPSD